MWCFPGTIKAFGEGALAGSVLQDGSTGNNSSVPAGNPPGLDTALGGAAFTDIQDAWNVQNNNLAFDNRFLVFNTGALADVPYQIDMDGSSTEWKIVGSTSTEITINPAAGVTIANPVELYPMFNLTIGTHGYATPLELGNGPSPTVQDESGGAPCAGVGFPEFVAGDEEWEDGDIPMPGMFF